MRTLVIVSVGIALALLFLAIGRRHGYIGVRRAAVAFTILWAVAMVANLALGLSHGYSLTEELPILLVNILPAACVVWLGAHLLRR